MWYNLSKEDKMITLKTIITPDKFTDKCSEAFDYMFVLSKGMPKTVHLIQDKPNKYAGYAARSTTHRYKDDGILKPNTTFKGKPTKEFGIRTNIWYYGTGWMVSTPDKIAYEHPAIFPDNLAKDHIISWSDAGDLILDPMCGSGTTCKMAKMLGRNYIGIDCSLEYCKLSERRLSQIERKLF